jgi:hypothetical protein
MYVFSPTRRLVRLMNTLMLFRYCRPLPVKENRAEN